MVTVTIVTVTMVTITMVIVTMVTVTMVTFTFSYSYSYSSFLMTEMFAIDSPTRLSPKREFSEI